MPGMAPCCQSEAQYCLSAKSRSFTFFDHNIGDVTRLPQLYSKFSASAVTDLCDQSNFSCLINTVPRLPPTNVELPCRCTSTKDLPLGLSLDSLFENFIGSFLSNCCPVGHV